MVSFTHEAPYTQYGLRNKGSMLYREREWQGYPGAGTREGTEDTAAFPAQDIAVAYEGALCPVL